MSTRCQIGFYRNESDLKKMEFNKWEALLYKHCDGYPEGIVPLIKPILQEFDVERGRIDIEYVSAYLVSKIKVGVLDVGICKEFHSDIEYFYAVCNKEIIVFKVHDIDKHDFREIERVSINS